jgi:adenine-specific DNA glycosylase
MKAIPRDAWIDFAHLIIFHGRRICQARKPKCPVCPVQDLCPSARYFLAGKVPPWERAVAAERAAAKVARGTAAGTARSATKKRARSRPVGRGRKTPRLKRS